MARGLIAQGPWLCPDNHATPATWAKFVTTSGDAGKASAMLVQASSYLGASLEDFDRDPLALNVRNGVLRFHRRGPGRSSPHVEFEPRHDPADRMTRICNADYDPDADRPHFDALLETSQPRADMRAYLAKVFGYCSTGTTKEQIFVILQGKGGDGKSTLVNAVRAVLGLYAVTAGVETVLDTGLRKSAEASPDIARLAGDTRLVCTAEPPGGAKLASSAIKAFSGGGAVSARELRQGIFEFEPTCKIVMECNRRPVINDTDDGIWRRTRVILFKRQVPEAERDLELPEKLRLEKSGILNWLVGGVLDWLANGLDIPEPVAQAIEDYRRGSNPFAEWLNDRVIIEPEARVLASEFYGDYKAWCDDNGHERPMGQTSFGRALGDLQILKDGKNGAGKVMRKGARLRTMADRVEQPSERGVIAPDEDEDPFR